MLEDIPWAGLGACMAGIGSLLSGIAAFRLATRRRKNNDSEHKASSADS